MEGNCPTGQSPRWAVVPMAEEDSGDFLVSQTVGHTISGTHPLFFSLGFSERCGSENACRKFCETLIKSWAFCMFPLFIF